MYHKSCRYHRPHIALLFAIIFNQQYTYTVNSIHVTYMVSSSTNNIYGYSHTSVRTCKFIVVCFSQAVFDLTSSKAQWPSDIRKVTCY